MPDLQPFQAPFAQPRDRLADWTLETPGRIGLADVVANAQPTVLIGTSGQANAFSRRHCARDGAPCRRPVIFPLSNPTSAARRRRPTSGLDRGRAVIGTGSPFAPIRRHGRDVRVDQTNNAYVYPGIGLGAIAVQARAISDAMFLTAARTVAELSPARATGKPTCCRRSSNCARFHSTWQPPWPSRQSPKGSRRRRRRSRSPRRCGQKCGSRFMPPTGGCPRGRPNRRALYNARSCAWRTSMARMAAKTLSKAGRR